MADNYFEFASNFELTIKLEANFTLANAQAYFDSLVQKIEAEDLTQINFKESNDFFTPDKEKGFEPFQCNKTGSGFNYRLKLPVQPDTTNNEQLKAKFNVLDLAPLRI